MSRRRLSHNGKVVLVVDDNPKDLATMGAMLSKAGYVAKLEEGMGAALDTVRKTHVDLVISDIRMPDASGKMDPEAGFKLLAQLRKEHPELPVSLFTRFSIDEYIQTALSHDVGNVLSKSASQDEMLKCVRMWTTGEGIFGLENYLPPGSTLFTKEFRTTDEVHALCNEVEIYLMDRGLPEAARGRARIMVEEIAVNAIVHSSDDYEDPLDAPKELASTIRSALLAYGGGADRFGLAVTDYMGLLTKRRVLQSLANVVLEKSGTWKGGRPAVSGRGIYMTRAFAKEYYINVKRSEMTEVVLITNSDSQISDVGRCSLKITEI